ncbi:MAG: ABC transporter permease [Clostridiales bacterium]|nr:ABC transporter permease [Clostridiales bacterium]
MKNETVKVKIKKEKHSSSNMLVMKSLLKTKSCIFGIVIITMLVLLSIFAPLISPYSYTKISILDAFATPSLEHPCGCDSMGRDILTRLLYGGRYSIGIGILSTLLGTVGGVLIGSIAGFFGGKTDLVIMRVVDIFQALPSILLAIVVAAVLGSGYIPTVLALGVSSIPGTVRTMRASILTVRGMDYVEAATSINCKSSRIIMNYVVPNAMAPVLVSISNSISSAVLAAASLSYIGLGVQPPYPEWGAMLTNGKDYIMNYPHLTLFPGLFIMIFVLAFNLFSDALRDALDPKLKK